MGRGVDPKPSIEARTERLENGAIDVMQDAYPGGVRDTLNQLFAVGLSAGAMSPTAAKNMMRKTVEYQGDGGSGAAIFTGLGNDGLRANIKHEAATRIGNRVAKDPDFVKWFENHDMLYGKNEYRAIPDYVVHDNMGRPYTDPADVGYRVAAYFMKSWATEVADSDSHALAWQIAAAREFGSDKAGTRAMLERSFYDSPDDARKDQQRYLGQQLRDMLDYDEPAMRAVHRAVYAETQEQLAKAGVTEVTLYRGLGLPVGLRVYPNFKLQANPLSSWTLSRGTAEDFSYDNYGTRPPHQVAAVVATTVPAKQVYSTPFAGVGCLNEAEFVLVNVSGSTARLS